MNKLVGWVKIQEKFPSHFNTIGMHDMIPWQMAKAQTWQITAYLKLQAYVTNLIYNYESRVDGKMKHTINVCCKSHC